MLARAAAKGLEVVEADAQHLPFENESFDAVTMISMLHHVEDRGAALAEARRILRVDGRLVLKGYTGEDAASLWVLDYFPSSRAWMERHIRRERRSSRSCPERVSSISSSRTWRTRRWRHCRPTRSECWKRGKRALRATSSECIATTLTSCKRGWHACARTSRPAGRQDARDGHGAQLDEALGDCASS
jgi:SAM-dependent methyltransferase